MQPTLLILAAGIGSRYGGVKQMDKIGPGGESILDYSIYDAIRAGFRKVVFVINQKIEKDFKAIYNERLKGRIEVGYVVQRLDSCLPKGVNISKERIKPWGTGHALLVAKDIIDGPFAVINADDFYGSDAFSKAAGFLSAIAFVQSCDFCMVGYQLKNTLSENGTVSRGVCEVNAFDDMVGVTERTKIGNFPRGLAYQEGEKFFSLTGNEVVSMNFWGFTPAIFRYLEEGFKDFIKANQGNERAEYLMPAEVNRLINDGSASVKMLRSADSWFGVTYKDDKERTIKSINELVESGLYPAKLWSE